MSGPCPFTPRPVPGTPMRPLPLTGCRVRIPSATLSDHLADHDDPHRTRDLVPALRFGDGSPSVLPTDKATDFYVDASTNMLYVMKDSDGTLRWSPLSSGSRMSGEYDLRTMDDVYTLLAAVARSLGAEVNE